MQGMHTGGVVVASTRSDRHANATLRRQDRTVIFACVTSLLIFIGEGHRLLGRQRDPDRRTHMTSGCSIELSYLIEGEGTSVDRHCQHKRGGIAHLRGQHTVPGWPKSKYMVARRRNVPFWNASTPRSVTQRSYEKDTTFSRQSAGSAGDVSPGLRVRPHRRSPVTLDTRGRTRCTSLHRPWYDRATFAWV
jgi:hypothetical protein